MMRDASAPRAWFRQGTPNGADILWRARMRKGDDARRRGRPRRD